MSLVLEALRSLFAHPLRSFLTLASVAFGAAVLFVLLAYSSGVPAATESVLRSMGGTEFVAEPRRARGAAGGGTRSGRQVRIRYADIETIAGACPSIAALAPSYSPGRGGPVFAADRSWPWARMQGVGHAYQSVTGVPVVEGRWFTPEEEVLASEVAIVSLPLAEGIFEGRSPLGETIDAGGSRFEIVGVYESDASFAYSVLVPYTTAMEMGDSGGRYVSNLAFQPQSPALAEEAVAEIRNALGTLYSFDPHDTTALDVKENIAFVARVEATSLALRVLVATIALLALVLGCLGAANVVGIAVAERTTELALRRALGATAARVRGEVLAEVLLLALVGGLAGLALGYGATELFGPLAFTRETRLVPAADPILVAVAVPLLVVVATLAGLPASARAARVEPAVALRGG